MRRTRPLLLLLLVVLSACSSTPQPPDVPPPPGTSPQGSRPVTITFGARASERAAYEPLIAAFEQQHPDVRVQFVAIDAALRRDPAAPAMQRVQQVAAAADTALLSYVTPAEMASDLLLDLTPLLDADPQFSRDDFYPAAGFPFTTASRTVLPLRVAVPLLAYHANLLTTQGLPPPSANWTLAELQAIAAPLMTKQPGVPPRLGLLGTPDMSSATLALLMATQAVGSNLVTAPNGQTLNQEMITTALRQTEQLVASGVVTTTTLAAMQPSPATL
ncbi:MAG: extracellular solute-binding protein, partial [Chloroflexaceae bacterium]|nr:extracellular solute-binding protein [Chloroflexaceae bacterium]